MPLAPIAAGALAGALVSSLVDEIKEHLKTSEDWKYMVDHLPETYDKLCKNIAKIAQADAAADIYETVNLRAQGDYKIKRNGLQHVMALAFASTPILVRVQGMGFYTPTLATSWRTLDYPDGSVIELPNGTAGIVPVLFLYSDTTLGNAI